MNFDDQFFDQITLISTPEHVGLIIYDNSKLDESGDKRAMNEIKRVLKFAGSVLVTVPYGKGQTSWYRSYNKKSLPNIFSGFQINDIKYFSENDLVWKEYDEESVSQSDNSKQVKGIMVVKATKIN